MINTPVGCTRYDVSNIIHNGTEQIVFVDHRFDELQKQIKKHQWKSALRKRRH